MSERFICIHGHFYQPPRENPWLEQIEFQESAQPYHDWNERVTAECYAPNAVSRIMDRDWRIIGLINNYSSISFNVGPTLLSWLETHHPEIYESILDADRESMNNFSGHGSAIAQVYNHMIMPLANRRDKETQVKWAIRDFQERFNRYPEGMWLPETAVDLETLEVLAQNDIKFTVLAPHQALKIRRVGEENWIDVSEGKIDPRRVYLCNLPSGKSIAIFFFDKKTATDIAFGNLLQNGEAFAKRLIDSLQDADGEPMLESIASDGELYGHHHSHGDMSLAYCLYFISSDSSTKLTNYAEFLSHAPPRFEVQIKENTSWSCIHGVERWRSDCGDNMGRAGWHQAWRRPLREAMDWLRDTLSGAYEDEASKYLKDPWEARNNYIDVMLDRSKENVGGFFAREAVKPLNKKQMRRVIKLLEMQRYAMLMYTSCGWFFDEISGLETVQVMKYAAKAMQLAHELFGLNLEGGYVRILKNAPSNISEFENGAKIYQIFIKPAIVDFVKISAQNTMIGLFEDDVKTGVLTPRSPNCCFKISSTQIEKRDDGKFRLLVHCSQLYSNITLDEKSFSSAALWLGDHNVSCGAKPNMQEEAFTNMRNEVLECFERGQINEIIVALSKYFGANMYTLKDLFRDDQKYIMDYILADGIKKAKDLYDIIYHDNAAMLRFMKEIRVPSPKPMLSAADVTLNVDMEQLLSAETPDLTQLRRVIDESNHLSVTLDSELLAYKASEMVADQFNKLSKAPENIETIRWISRLIQTVSELPIKLNLWQSQNVAFKIAEKQYKEMKDKQSEDSNEWVTAFTHLCELIGIRLA